VRTPIITFKIQEKPTLVSKWLSDHNLIEKTVFDWHWSRITFYDEEDAMAFCLRFGSERIETKIEEMIRNEKSND
jgi:hypothetical protein